MPLSFHTSKSQRERYRGMLKLQIPGGGVSKTGGHEKMREENSSYECNPALVLTNVEEE